MVPRKIKFWIAGLIGLAIIIVVLLAIFSFFILLLPVAIALFIIGILFRRLYPTSKTNRAAAKKPTEKEDAAIDVDYRVK